MFLRINTQASVLSGGERELNYSFNSSPSHDAGNDIGRHSFDASKNVINSVLIFLGSTINFSDRLLRTTTIELEGIEVLRMRDPQELYQLDRQSRGAIKLVIVDEASMDLLPQSPRELNQVTCGVGAVLAYRLPEVARKIRRAARQSGTETQLRFLPMQAPLDTWFAVLRLLLLGEKFVPAELLDDDAYDRTLPIKPMEDNGPVEEQQSVVAGQLYFSPNLTVRENQVMKLVAEGLSNRSIADELGLSEHTVKLHLHHVFGKLGVRNRTSATHWFLSRNEPTKDTGNEGTP